MKTSKILLLIAFAFILLGIVVTLSSIRLIENKSKVDGYGDVVTEVRKIPVVKKLEINDKIRVSLEQSEEQQLIVEADSNLVSLIITEVIDSTLVIRLTQNVRSYHSLNAELKLSTLEKINVTNGGRIESVNEFMTPRLQFNASAGSKIDLLLNCEELKCEIGTGAHGDVEGITEKLEVDISTGSNMDMKDLKANNIIANASSGAILSVFAKGSMTLNANTGGRIKYYGEPESRNIEQNTGGQVVKRD